MTPGRISTPLDPYAPYRVGRDCARRNGDFGFIAPKDGSRNAFVHVSAIERAE